MTLEVTMLVNLKTSKNGVVMKGTKFCGRVDELPGFVALMVENKEYARCQVVEISDKAVVEVAPEQVVEVTKPVAKRKKQPKKK